MTDRKPVSHWEASAAEHPFEQAFTETKAVDVAIVGGGYTGLSTALHCAEKGLSAHVLEAEHIGYGGSGRNVGFVNAAAWLPPHKIHQVLGEDAGARFIRVFSDAPDYVFSLIEKHQIQCAPTKTGTLHVAHARSGLENLKERHKDWQRLGAPVDLLNREEAAEKVGSAIFHGALLDHRAGTINPMGYCRGLARAAHGAGATISTDVRVNGLKRTGSLWGVQCNHGEIEAKNVVLGTNAYTDQLWPNLNRCFMTIHFFQMATVPFGQEIARILPERQGLWDTAQVMLSLRKDVDNRLVIGSMGKLLGSAEGGLSSRWARTQIKRIFPFLDTIEFEEAWHGQIAMTPDHLPRIYKLDDGLYTPIGYNGRGITTGTVFGQAMADVLTGRDEGCLPLPVTTPKSVRASTFKSRCLQTVFACNQFLKSM